MKTPARDIAAAVRAARDLPSVVTEIDGCTYEVTLRHLQHADIPDGITDQDFDEMFGRDVRIQAELDNIVEEEWRLCPTCDLGE